MSSKIRVYPSCILFDVLDPQPQDIHIGDIAHHLSMLCRFTGGVSRFYSVAEHCARMCARMESAGARRELLFAALLHDASEAYLNDVNRPLKRTEQMQGYRDVEERMMRAIYERFGISEHTLLKAEWDQIDEYDRIMLRAEQAELQNPDRASLLGWSPASAREQFLDLARAYVPNPGTLNPIIAVPALL
jgi:hypothetical protein